MFTGKPFTNYGIDKAIVVAIALLPAANAHASTVTYRTVALTGDVAADTSDGATWDNLFTPVLNENGHVAFTGRLKNADVDPTYSVGIWSEGHGALSLVTRTGSVAPGTESDTTFSNLWSTLHLNNAGNVAFKATLDNAGSGTNTQSLWAEDYGQLNLIVRSGDSAPGVEPGVTFDEFYSIGYNTSFAFNNAGTIAFSARLQGPDIGNNNHSGIWRADSTTSEMIARMGDQAPGMDAGVVYSHIGAVIPNGGTPRTTPVINDSGDIAFAASLAGIEPQGFRDSGVWLNDGIATSLIAATGQSAPGMPLDIEHIALGNPVINNQSDLAYGGLLSNGTLPTVISVWSDVNNTNEVIAYPGLQLPELGLDVELNWLFQPIITSSGQVVVYAHSISELGTAILSHYGNTWSAIARSGVPAPGTTNNRTFSSLFDYVTNDLGQVAFYARTIPPGQPSESLEGIWATDQSGLPKLIVKEGDLFDINDDPLIDDYRTVDGMSFVDGSGGEDGNPRSFNDAGQLAFRLTFTDGSSGIFVATVSIPGDLNGDGFVGIDDLTAVLNNWNQNVSPGDALAGDATGDGFVGIDDLNTVLPNWNAGTPPGTSTSASNLTPNAPEPASLLIFTGLLGLLGRRV